MGADGPDPAPTRQRLHPMVKLVIGILVGGGLVESAIPAILHRVAAEGTC